MIVNRCSENLLTKSKKLYENYRDNCTVVQRMLEKYKKIYPNISDYSIMHFIDIAEFCDLIRFSEVSLMSRVTIPVFFALIR